MDLSIFHDQIIRKRYNYLCYTEKKKQRSSSSVLDNMLDYRSRDLKTDPSLLQSFRWYFKLRSHLCRGALVAQWVKLWPTDLAVLSSSPARGENFSPETEFHCTQPFIIIHPSSWYDWNTVEKDVKWQVIHPSHLHMTSLLVGCYPVHSLSLKKLMNISGIMHVQLKDKEDWQKKECPAKR